MRWGLRLLPYNFKIKHVRGIHNRIPDFVSRYVLKVISEEETQFREYALPVNNLIILDNVKLLRKEKQKDPELKALIELKAHTDLAIRCYDLMNGILYRKIRNEYEVVFPKSVNRDVWHKAHSGIALGNNQGYAKTYGKSIGLDWPRQGYPKFS